MNSESLKKLPSKVNVKGMVLSPAGPTAAPGGRSAVADCVGAAPAGGGVEPEAPEDAPEAPDEPDEPLLCAALPPASWPVCEAALFWALSCVAAAPCAAVDGVVGLEAFVLSFIVRKSTPVSFAVES